ncbi:Glycosyl transferase, group 1 [Trichormus variabilis ATCC 29413]|uniref:Glycosyl transferase, group 1 n=2 Tax=Anabaena variabilis TaxID=264691 RepID=Q3M3J6_TRIV2|nr:MULTISPECIES: glycosyltransferase family 4 protein [Nostocaceae]ABA24440.1 Glycosyl transferase, group 1 [Trichormus variabilis ATCC 29413]MBC1214347.1 glycosyltransferase family 4 protein [Trichormus variabilis ARAD]MBC1258205.1 glycosyltransferase family 4 protein [Trichormus variabilis V5]MBC1268459.1 glycosyltransferase family 4 protein [Trichormus variabilis FSR]MBC1303877.1 glycosyltransferase family 4 protein [Trichormus variabilis N2B]
MNRIYYQKSPLKVLMLGASLDVQGGITSVEKLIIENVRPELQITHVATFAPGSGRHNIFVFLQSIKILIQNLIQRKTDLVHIHFAERGSTFRKLILVLIILSFRQPFILHAHGATYQEFFADLPKILQKIISNLFRRCSQFIALSESWKSYYLETFNLDKNQISVLHNPVKMPTFIPVRRQKQSVKFVFLGRIGKRGGALDVAKSVMKFPQQDKGAFDLIKAFAALPEESKKSAELVLAGNGDLDKAQQLIQELGLEAQVKISAWLNPEQRDALIASADVFVLPSYNEGLPMSMLEAMSWGLPVIVTPVGGIPEVINHNQNGILVQPGNQQQLVQAMQQLINDEDMRIALGNAARHSVEYFDVKHYINSLSETYFSAVQCSNYLVNSTTEMESKY